MQPAHERGRPGAIDRCSPYFHCLIRDFRRIRSVVFRLMRSLFLSVVRRFVSSSAGPVLWATRPSVGDDGEPIQGSVANAAPDPDDMHDLMVEHSDAVFRLAFSVVRDRSLAEDVTQEAMLKAWLALPTFRGESSLRGWIMRIAHNTAISTLRSRRSIVSDPNEMPEAPIILEKSTERRVEGAAVVDEFVEALDLLDDLSRSIVVLRELEGMSYDEISQVLDVPLPTIKTRLLRSRRFLSNALKEWQ